MEAVRAKWKAQRVKGETREGIEVGWGSRCRVLGWIVGRCLRRIRAAIDGRVLMDCMPCASRHNPV